MRPNRPRPGIRPPPREPSLSRILNTLWRRAVWKRFDALDTAVDALREKPRSTLGTHVTTVYGRKEKDHGEVRDSEVDRHRVAS